APGDVLRMGPGPLRPDDLRHRQTRGGGDTSEYPVEHGLAGRRAWPWRVQGMVPGPERPEGVRREREVFHHRRPQEGPCRGEIASLCGRLREWPNVQALDLSNLARSAATYGRYRGNHLRGRLQS